MRNRLQRVRQTRRSRQRGLAKRRLARQSRRLALREREKQSRRLAPTLRALQNRGRRLTLLKSRRHAFAPAPVRRSAILTLKLIGALSGPLPKPIAVTFGLISLRNRGTSRLCAVCPLLIRRLIGVQPLRLSMISRRGTTEIQRGACQEQQQAQR